MDDSFLFFVLGKSVVAFRNDFNYVGGRYVKCFLPHLAESVNAGDGSSGTRAFASETKHILRNDVEEFEAFGDLVCEFFDIWGF